MTQWLKQLTAGTIHLGPFVDDGDGKTVEPSLTISQGDILLSKAGGSFAQISGTANATHGTLGYYAVTIGTADTDTLGRLKVAVHESGALPVWESFMVVPANTWDSLIGGTDYLDVTAMGTVTANVVGGTVAVATSVTDPVTVSGGTVAVATSVTNSVTVSGGTVGVATSVTNPVTVSGGTVAVVSGAVTLNARTVEGSIDEIEAWKLALAALAGKSSGGGTGTLVFRDTGDTTDRITATVDANKNRTAVTLDVT